MPCFKKLIKPWVLTIREFSRPVVGSHMIARSKMNLRNGGRRKRKK
jgi:hypothetical protein